MIRFCFLVLQNESPAYKSAVGRVDFDLSTKQMTLRTDRRCVSIDTENFSEYCVRPREMISASESMSMWQSKSSARDVLVNLSMRVGISSHE